MHSTVKSTDNVIHAEFGANDNQREPDAGVSPTEDGVAKVFANAYRNDLRYCHTAGAWFEWSGSHWCKDEVGLASHYVRVMSREMSKGTNSPKTLAAIRKKSFANGVEKFAASDPLLARSFRDWDSDPFLLGTPGGTVDLRTGKLRDADPADCITKVTSVTPLDIAHCPLWLAFLDQATGCDKEMIRFLQQWSGYCLTGDTREHALVFVYGGGGNGKSVFLNTVSHIMLDYAVTSSMDTFVESRSDRHPTDLAMLRGARLVTASETEAGKAWAESRIKSLTGGDPITARFMRQNFFTFMPLFKLCVVGNHQPRLQNVDDAARRRFNMVPFIRKPEKPDRQLEAKLRGEAPAILRWMIEGCLDWQRNGLVRPTSIVEATEAYFAEQDVFGQWLSECCHTDPNKQSISEYQADLFESWTAYAEESGEKAGSRVQLGKMLEKRGFAKRRGNRGQRHLGIQFLPEERKKRNFATQ
ncbi:phage/plasmid primase, P4 family [Bradyrhizobium sp. LeoA1S1]